MLVLRFSHMEVEGQRADAAGVEVERVCPVSHVLNSKIMSHILPWDGEGMLRVAPGHSPPLHPSLGVCGSYLHPGELGKRQRHPWSDPEPSLYCQPPSLSRTRPERPLGDLIWELKALPWDMGPGSVAAGQAGQTGHDGGSG